MNLLMPNGQFGTRDQGGKDHAAARYIFTELAPIIRNVMHPADDAILTYQQDDGKQVEPEWYMPIIPTVLINGAEGIGTGKWYFDQRLRLSIVENPSLNIYAQVGVRRYPPTTQKISSITFGVS